MEESRSLMAALSVNVVTVNLFLSVFCLSDQLFVSGDQTPCGKTPDLSVTAPKEIEALSGSCLQIPCSFRETQGEMFDSTRTKFGVWIKSDPVFKINVKNIIFNSSKTQNTYNMTIRGNLSEKNCTTEFYDLTTSQTDKYFFRIENEPFKATASCDPVQIRVRDSAWSPMIEMSADVKKKNSVTITCSAFTPCPHSPPELSWDLQQDSDRQTEVKTDGTFTTKIQTSISLSDSGDGYNISCGARYPVMKPREGLVSAGSWVFLKFSRRAKPSNRSFTCFTNSKHEVMKEAEGGVYRFNITERLYYCELPAEGEGTNSSFLQTSLISLAVVGLICLVVTVWFFKFKHQTPQQAQSETADELVLQMPANKREEELHYEDVNVLMKKAKPSSVSELDSRQQEETVYSQVKVSEPRKTSARTADSPEELYSQVKKN